jgi:hypothetical protein
MTWRAAPAFVAQHDYPPLQSPRENHPPAYGRLQRAIYLTDGVRNISVRQTARRRDGWSYVVICCKEQPWWFGYFHHARTGKRVRHSGTAPASAVELNWGLDPAWRDAAPL